MFDPFTQTSELLRFDGPTGWFYVPFDDAVSRALRPLVTSSWPALMKVKATVDAVSWTASVMPIRDGPLFVAFPARIRKRLGVHEGDVVTVAISPRGL